MPQKPDYKLVDQDLNEVAKIIMADAEAYGLPPGDFGAALLMASRIKNDPDTGNVALAQEIVDTREIRRLKSDPGNNLSHDQAVTTHFLRSNRS